MAVPTQRVNLSNGRLLCWGLGLAGRQHHGAHTQQLDRGALFVWEGSSQAQAQAPQPSMHMLEHVEPLLQDGDLEGQPVSPRLQHNRPLAALQRSTPDPGYPFSVPLLAGY